LTHERRIFAEFPPEAVEVTASADDSHHLQHVLRLGPGALVTLVSRTSGIEYQAMLIEGGKQARLKILSARKSVQSQSRLRILAPALLKGDANDFICQQAAVLGVQHVAFWQAARSIARPGGGPGLEKKTVRWKRVFEAAARQCGRNSIPEVSFSSSAGELLDLVSGLSEKRDLFLCCSLGPHAREMREFPEPGGAVHIILGPEGDFTSGEEKVILQRGFQPVSLGPLRLRSETAAFVAAATVNGLWGFRP